MSHKERMGHTFTQHKKGTEYNASKVLGKDRTTLNSTCYNCCKPGHLAYSCPDAGRIGTCSFQVIHSFAQKQIQKNDPIDNNWVLLEMFSSSSVLKNASLATNVRNCNSEEKLLMLTNGGHISFNQMGDLLQLPMKVHINESSLANILPFAEVSNIAGVHIKMDMSK